MTFTIAHLSDPHLSPAPFPPWREMRLKRFMGYVNWRRGRASRNDMAMLGRLVADLREHSPNHVAMTGDVVNIALAIEFERAAAWMRTLGDADDVSFTPGNHDAYVPQALDGLDRTFAPWTSSDAGATAWPNRFPYLRRRGEIALIGLSSGVPTAPLLASGRLGKLQQERFAALLRSTGGQGLARIVLIHHPPLSRGPSPPLRGLDDARGFEAAIAEHGAELVLHGHTHKRMVHFLPSKATGNENGRVPVVGAPSASAATPHDPRELAAYYLFTVERAGKSWRISGRSRGLSGAGAAIVERETLAL